MCVCVREREGGCLLVYLLPSHSKDFGMKHCKSTAPPFPDPCIFAPIFPPQPLHSICFSDLELKAGCLATPSSYKRCYL